MARTRTTSGKPSTRKPVAATTPTPLTGTAIVAGLGGVPASPSVPQPLAPVTPPVAPVAAPVVVVAPRAVAATPVAVAVATRLTAPLVAGGAPTNARLTGTMLATLQALATAGTGITHTALALATGRNKGNQLRPLLALGLTSTYAMPGTRGYVYAITPAGSAALAAATPAAPVA